MNGSDGRQERGTAAVYRGDTFFTVYVFVQNIFVVQKSRVADSPSTRVVQTSCHLPNVVSRRGDEHHVNGLCIRPARETTSAVSSAVVMFSGA